MKVILHKLFPYAPYLNEYIGFEMDIPDDGDPIAEVETLRKLAEQSHRGRYPHLYENGNESIVQSFHVPPEPSRQSFQEAEAEQQDQIQGMKWLINSKWQTKKTLENLKEKVQNLNNKEVTEIFNNKLKSFQ